MRAHGPLRDGDGRHTVDSEVLLALVALLGCSPDSGLESGLPSALHHPVETQAAEHPRDADDLGAVTPYACARTINVAQTGWSVETPVPADLHAEVYGVAPAPYHTHLGWSGDPSSSASMIWRTDADTLATQVQIGPDDSLGTTIEGASFLLSSVTDDGRVHEAHVCGLTPGTTWHYRVGGPGGWSNIHTFTTAPPPGSPEPIVFGVAGDTRGGTTVWSQILDAMRGHGVEFRVFTGDAVVTGSTISQWDDWYEAGVGYMESVPTIMAHGNHEGLSQAHFGLIAAPGNEEWYSFDYGDAHFAAFNDTPGATADWAEQAAWLADDLAGTSRTWKITFHHKPAYSGCRPNGEDMNVRTYMVPVQEAGGVQLDLAGHNHNYERTVPLRGGVEVPQTDGITYVVTAGGGAPLYDNNQNWSYTATFAETQHYVIGRIEAGTLTLTAYDLAGNVLDVTTLLP